MHKKYILLLFMIFPEIFWGQTPSKSAAIDSLFTQLYQEGRFNGNVLIAEKGKVIFEKSYGLADPKTGRTLNKNTIFDLASVTKEFTAAGILLLQKQGKLEIDDPISKYIPELKFYGPITIDQLIHHTSGLPLLFPTFQKYWNPPQRATNKDVVHLFAKYRPQVDFAPEEDFEYNNTNYVLLGYIIEKVAGKSYGKFLKENIFTPLKMNHTRVYRRYYDDFDLANYALSYIPGDHNKPIAVDDLPATDFHHYLDGIVGAGEIKSTTRDLLKWDRALRKDSLFNRADKKLMFSPVQLKDGRTIHYGFGWVLQNEKPFGKIVYHPGRWAGYINHFERDITHDKTLIILQNNDLPQTITPKNSVRNILYGLQFKKVPQQLLQQYAGVYKNDRGAERILKFENGKLFYVRDANDIFRMEALSNDKFKASQYLFDVYFKFKTAPKTGRISLQFDDPEENIHEVLLRQP